MKLLLFRIEIYNKKGEEKIIGFIRFVYVSLILFLGVVFFFYQSKGGFMNLSFIIWIPVLGSIFLMIFSVIRKTWLAGLCLFLLIYYYLSDIMPVIKERFLFSVNFTVASFLLLLPFIFLGKLINNQKKDDTNN